MDYQQQRRRSIAGVCPEDWEFLVDRAAADEVKLSTRTTWDLPAIMESNETTCLREMPNFLKLVAPKTSICLDDVLQSLGGITVSVEIADIYPILSNGGLQQRIRNTGALIWWKQSRHVLLGSGNDRLLDKPGVVCIYLFFGSRRHMPQLVFIIFSYLRL